MGWWFWLLCVFILLAVMWALPWSFRNRAIPPEEETLRERYARGEITQEEFRQSMRELSRAA